MKKTKIKFVSKNRLYPAFGEAKNNTVYVRNDLPNIVKKFIISHELYYLEDKTHNWFLRELKASFYGLFRHPFGFFICVIMSLSPYRLKFYFDRLKKGE